MKTVIDILNNVLRASDKASERFGGACAMVADRGDGRGAVWCVGGAWHMGDHVEKRLGEPGATYEALCPAIAPGDRTRAIQRVGYLMPALTDDALHAVLLVAEAAPKRSLDRATLDDAQRAREGDPLALDPEDGTLCAGCAAPRNAIHGAMCPVRAGVTVGRKMANAKPHTCEAGTPSGLMLNLEPVEVREATAADEAEIERMLASGEMVIMTAEPEATAEQHDREVAALRSQVEALTTQVERFKSGPERQAVDAAAERLGFVYLEPDGEGFKAREALFEAMGALFGEAVKREPAIVAGARRAIEGRPVPGEVVEVEHSGERGLRHRDGCNGRRPKDGGSAWGTEPCDGCEVRS